MKVFVKIAAIVTIYIFIVRALIEIIIRASVNEHDSL